jgi:membrane associated rhomboid family serine protease
MVIPLRDSVRGQVVPWVNYGLVGLNTLVFLLQVADPVLFARMLEYCALVPAHLLDPGTLLRRGFWPLVTLFTSTFLHGSWLHLIGNMLYLWVFGDNVEDRLGHRRYLGFYLLSGGLAGLAHALANPTATIPTVGASGAVAGVLGAYVITYPQARVLTLVPLGLIVPAIRIRVWAYLGLWFLIQLYSGLMPLWAHQVADMVAWWAHISGFLIGISLLKLLAPSPEPLA